MATLAGVEFTQAHAEEGSTSAEYRRTVAALDRYRILAAEDEGGILPSTKKPVKRGERYAGVPRLARLLSLIGDLAGGTGVTDSETYSDALVAAVKRFQTRHGLEPDGRIGKRTLTELNTPLSFRVRQLELALERWRQVPYDPARPAIILNLPEFRLRAFGPSHHPELEMKIIIGRAGKLRTPIFSAEMDSILFRPFWNVPIRIQRDELVGEIMRDPTYLAKNDFELVTPKGAVVTEDDVAGTLLAQLRSAKLHLRQRPGPKNALGLVKFVFPNEYDVYMHDTPGKSLFSRARRDFSHGCIRLEKPVDLAEWVMREESGWPRDRILAAMQGKEAKDSVAVKLQHPIPVTITYVTAVALEGGEVHFLEDIYGEDAALEKELGAATPEPETTSGEPGQHPRE